MNYKKIISIIVIGCIIYISTISIRAINNPISIEAAVEFNDEMWYPGKVESNDFYINNTGEDYISIDRIYIYLKSSEYYKTAEKLNVNSKQFKEFAKNSTVILKHGEDELFKGRFENLLSNKGINLSKKIYIEANNKALLNMAIDMDVNMNNDAQALKNIFSIGVAYKIEEITPPSYGDGGFGDIEDSIDNDIDIDGDSSEKLPQTGGIINAASLSVLGILSIGAGIVLNRKSGKKEGGKHNG